jgi:hypothetical protein
MKSVPIVCAAALLTACQTTPVAPIPAPQEAVKSQWQESTLSPDTIQRANQTVRDYRQCLNDATLALLKVPGDPRALSDRVLRQCEDRLAPIKDAYDREGVPASISERYQRRTRSQGAQSVLRVLMEVAAQRASEQSEGK